MKYAQKFVMSNDTQLKEHNVQLFIHCCKWVKNNSSEKLVILFKAFDSSYSRYLILQ